MTAPYGYTYPPAPAAQPAPQYPPQGYAPQPQYAPAPQYGAPPMPGYPPVTMAPPPQPLAQGSIDDFYSQPVGGGGAFLKWDAPGRYYAGYVARAIVSSDVRQETTPPNQGSQPRTYKDGRPKFELVVPLQLTDISQEHPDGKASWAIKGQDRDELSRAMAEAGAPEGPPEAGAFIQIVFTHTEPTKGGIPRKVKRISYTRPGEQPVLLQAPQQPAQPQYVQQVQYAQQPPAQVYAQPAQPQYASPAPAQPQYAPPAQPQQVQQLPQGQYAQATGPAVGPNPGVQIQQPMAQAPAQQAAPAQPMAMPQDFTSDQQARLTALLAGQGQPQPQG